MSLPPSGWINPKVVWAPPDPIGVSDLQRIEGNINMFGRLLPWFMAPSDSVVIAESLTTVRSFSDITGTWNDETGKIIYYLAKKVASKTFRVTNPGIYRVTGEFRVSSARIRATVLGVSTTSTGFVQFSGDVQVMGIDNVITIPLDISMANPGTGDYYAYMQNVRIKAVPATVLPVDRFVSQVSY